MNAAHLFTIAELMQTPGWEVISPWSGPRQLVTWIAVLLASTEGLDVQDALQRVFALRVDQLLDCLSTGD